MFERAAKRYPNKDAIVYKDTRLSYKLLNERINRLANALIDLGLKRQDRVSVILDNCYRYIEIVGACAKAGLILAPVSTKLKDELDHILGNAEPRVVFAGQEHVHKIKQEYGYVEKVVLVAQESQEYQEGSKEYLDYEKLISQYEPDEPEVAVDESDIIFLYYTSGTTSLPKGAALSHRAIVSNAVNGIIENQLRHDDVNLSVHPLFFSAPVNCSIILMVYLGGSSVILDAFEPESFLRTVEQEKVSIVVVVPTMIVRLLQYPDIDKWDVSSLRAIMYGSSAMPESVISKAIAKFGNIFHQGYGLTETTCFATMLSADQHVVGDETRKIPRLRSCGREVVNTRVRIIRKNGTDIDRDMEEVGEIIIKGDNIMDRYWNMPELTAETIKDGWFYTGDLGSMDEDGYVYIVDREKDMIVSGAINIYPREVEEVLYKHPDIVEVSVIGLPNEDWGEKVVALVVLKQGAEVSEKDLIAYTKEHLATYKAPKSCIFVEDLPKGPTGKILKRVLKEEYSKG
ncbi:MAG: long-chain-fatty-acid--CoA ligase [Proteobacteria bacterium]|nr:long-chain-fatty-acid--CoA ligase [Pseudomonadota bacterium]MBU2468494.1 long-chain-fatty-acid--CoA ligase [Pseudomonadota bacterium]